MFRLFGSLCSPYGGAAPPSPAQGGNAPSVPSAVSSLNHDAVNMEPIASPSFVKDVPAENSMNGIGFKVYSFGGDLPPDLHIEHTDMTGTRIRDHITGTGEQDEVDKEVEIAGLEFGSQRMYSCDFSPCVPVFAYYPPGAGESSEIEVPMALFHAQAYAKDRLDDLLASAKYGQPTDIFVVTRSFPPENREWNCVKKQSATALYVHANLPVGTKFHVIEVPAGSVAVRVAANKIEVWKTQY